MAGACARLFEQVAPDSLAPKNLRGNKRFVSIVTLITIGISVILLIDNANRLLISATNDAFGLLGYQIEAIGAPTDDGLVEKLGQEGIAYGQILKKEGAIALSKLTR